MRKRAPDDRLLLDYYSKLRKVKMVTNTSRNKQSLLFNNPILKTTQKPLVSKSIVQKINSHRAKTMGNDDDKEDRKSVVR